MSSLAAPSILLTGGSRGLGLALLLLLLSNNAQVTTISRSIPAELESVKDRFPDRVEIVQGDVGNIEDNARVVQRAVERFGGISGVIINAGTIHPERISDIPLQSAAPYTQANLLSVLYIVQPTLPYLRASSGRIVLVSSGASSRGYTSWGLYSMVKAGMNSLARTLAAEEKTISIWAIRPGLVDTSMQTLLRSDGQGKMDPEEMAKFTAAHENGQLLDPMVCGRVIAGLALDGPKDLSGEYLDWADEKLAKFSL